MIDSLGMLTFLAPWWAVGLIAAVAIPLLAHLLSRAHYREAWFPATRLVQQAVVVTTRVDRPRHLLMLLLRLLLLLLLVAAFMRPCWSPQAEAAAPEQGVHLIVLLDTSASMGRVSRGSTLYERAAREARVLISGLDPSKDLASVVKVDRSPRLLLPEPSANLSALRLRLDASTSGFEHADWPSAVSQTERLIERSKRAVRVVVISDQQGDIPQLAGGLLQGKRIDQIRIDGPADNTAVRLLDVVPYPPIAGRPVTVAVEAAHFGGHERDVELRASLGGSSLTRPMRLVPGVPQRVDLVLPAGKQGVSMLRVGIDRGDAISADDRDGVLVSVRQDSRVLILHQSSGDDVLAARLGAALNPGGKGGAGLATVELVDPDDAERRVAAADPADVRTVVLLPGVAVSDTLSQRLEAYAQRGGGVVRFVGHRHAPPGGVTASGIDFGLDPLRLFEGPARGGLARLVWLGVGSAPIDKRATPILEAEDGRVIVASLDRGRGRVVAINAALSADPGGLLAEPAFVVLFNELCRYASPGPSLPVALKPGDPLPVSLLASSRWSSPEGAVANSDRVTAPGPYLSADPNGQILEGVFASLDPRESDTGKGGDWLPHAQAKSEVAASPANAGALLASIRPHPIELWPYLIVGVMLIAGAESALLWRFARAMRGGV